MTALGILSTVAQTGTYSDPKTLDPAGVNSYDGSDSYTYWVYTPSADEIVTFSNIGIYGLEEKVSGEEVPYYANSSTYDESQNMSLFQVKADVTYLISIYRSWSVAKDYTIDCSVRECPYNLGYELSAPVVLSPGANNFLATTGVQDGWYGPWTYTPVYMELTSTVDGVADLAFRIAPQAIAWAEKTPSLTDADFETLAAGTRVSLDVENGKTYVFKVEAQKGNLVVPTLRIPIPGTSCQDAWKATEGANVIPAAAGVYWYKYTVPQDGYMTIVSDADASISIDSSCDPTYPDPKTGNRISFRFEVVEGAGYVFSITKTEATAAPESFDITTGPAQPGDTESNPLAINSGDRETSVFGGTYYYKLADLPTQGNWFVDVQKDSSATGNIQFVLNQYNSQYAYWYEVASKQNSLHYELKPGLQYMLKVTTAQGAAPIPYTIEYNAVLPGQTRNAPLTIATGANSLNAWSESYYTYTPDQECWLVLNLPQGVSAPNCTLVSDEYTSIPAVSIEPAEGFASACKYKMETVAPVIFKFSNVEQPASFDFSLQDLLPGENYSTALDMPADGILNLPEEAGTVWYKYTVAETGFVVISTDMRYDSSQRITAYVNNLSDAKVMSSSYNYENGGYVWSPLKVAVQAGDVVYLKIARTVAEAGKTVTLVEQGADPGETPATAIRVEMTDGIGHADVPVVSSYGGSPVYLVVELDGGVFFTSCSKQMGAIIYSNIACTSEYQIGSCSSYETYKNDEGASVYGLNKIVIPAAGNYYIKVTSAGGYYDYNPIPTTFINRAALPGEAATNPVEIEVSSTTLEWTVLQTGYDGWRWYSINLNPGTLSIVTDNFTINGGLYSPEDMSLLATFQRSSDYTYSTLNAEIVTAGTYLIKVEQMTYTEGTATISGTALEGAVSVEAPAAASFKAVASKGMLMLSGEDVTASVYDVNGRAVANVALDGTVGIDLAPGFYIVSDGNSALKVLVK